MTTVESALTLVYEQPVAPAATRLPTLQELHGEYPLSRALRARVGQHRRAVVDVLTGADDRLLLLVGPCSVHDPAAALDYAGRLAALAREHAADLLVVMRCYVEKPRSVAGWKGLVCDPWLDGSDELDAGLRVARRLFLQVAAAGLPLATEVVQPLLAPYLCDLVTWAAVGARTVASQPHRELASALPMPVGMKNGLDGDVGPAVAAVQAAAVPHAFPGQDERGRPAVLRSTGNPDCHVVLRGGSSGPNFDAASVAAALDRLRAAGLPARVVVDASHGNSGKDHRRQAAVIGDLAGQVAAGQTGIAGVMVESFLAEGRQDVLPGRPIAYGLSITDACIGWDATVSAAEALAAAVRTRRTHRTAADG